MPQTDCIKAENGVEATVLDLQISNRDFDTFAWFCSDGCLYLHHLSIQETQRLVRLENIGSFDKPIKMYYHHPYVCVTERFGLNAVVVDLRDRWIMTLSRGDYHADVSSYSIGFLSAMVRPC